MRLVLLLLILMWLPAPASAQEVQRPHDILNRAEAITAALRSTERFAPQVVWFKSNLPEIALFTDTDQTAWYAPYIEVGFLEGIISGFPDGSYRPADPLLVSHAMALLERIHGREIATPYTSDIPITRKQFFAIVDGISADEGTGTYVFSEPASEKEHNIQHTAKEFTKIFGALPNVLPASKEQPFVLTLPPKRTDTATLESSTHPYGSQKSFAISIPSLSIEDIAIIHPDDPFSQDGILAPLKEGLGHLFAYPGNPGKAMIYGHSSGYPWDLSEFTRIFRRINELQSGDRIYITYDKHLYVYEVVRKQIIAAKDVSPFDEDGNTELILYTCWPPDSIAERYLVHALPVEIVALR